MKSKRWIWHVLRVAVTAAAVAYVLHIIQFRDSVLIREGGGTTEVTHASVTFAGDRATVAWEDGRTREYPAPDVRVRQGFLSLFERTDKRIFFPMAAALLAPFFLLALRWWLLLRGQGFAAPFGRIFFVTYAGAFFNNFLPGSVGGDLAKAILAASGEERKAAVVGTVILDRVIGLAVMIVLGAACLTPFVGRFEDRRIAWMVYGLFGAMVLAYAVYFNRTARGWLGDRLPFRKTFAELDGVFRSAREKKPLVAGAAGISLLAQASAIFIIYGLARAMGIGGVALWVFFVFEPIIFIVTALPISMGGWGVQEFVYQQLFGTFAGVDANQAVALSVLYKLSLILVSIPGGVLFALGATRRPSQAKETKGDGVTPETP